MTEEVFPVSSSNIEKIAYDKEDRRVRIWFANGSEYTYSDVPEADFLLLKNAPSVGSYFSKVFRESYAGTCVSGPKRTATVAKPMRLWLLKSKLETGEDMANGFVVRASESLEARRLVGAQAGYEGADAWMSSAETDCAELTSDGPSAVILRDFTGSDGPRSG